MGVEEPRKAEAEAEAPSPSEPTPTPAPPPTSTPKPTPPSPPPQTQEDHVVAKKKEEETEEGEKGVHQKDVAEEKSVIPPLVHEKPAPAIVQSEKDFPPSSLNFGPWELWGYFGHGEIVLLVVGHLILLVSRKFSQIADPASAKCAEGPIDRDTVLARVEAEKRLALIKAWEESEKTKAENKAYKKMSAVGSWENTKRAAVEAQLRKIEEKLEKKKAEYAEKMKNKMAEVHKAAEEKRAMVEANRLEQHLKVEETAAKYRAAGYTPKKLLGCFSS
ncbi:hypothetical protein FEM48_Zijuj11G0038200 [Ziziphus jujuba var. spinosa]|uniref:Remorin C-terminal domain-containing protein n=1 Tax=Ziziphus jujuba var. spinosa TaxID=714518 RepID=A0A978UGM9_ZIZJJ|nr:hypothetical protein FEM48_Zijuj11G0038200 [Ziziphus jujuba var. spinosa]